MARRKGMLRGLGAGLGAGIVALSSFLVVALATPGATEAFGTLAPLAKAPVAAAKPAGKRATQPAPYVRVSGQPVSETTGSGAGTGNAPSSLPASAVAQIKANADWIMQSQLPDGALATYIDQSHITPYGSGYAALGLARAAEVTGDSAYLTAAWRFLSWYQAHEDANGYTTDYNVTNGVEVSNGNMDSTDAYAGMFLAAAGETWKASHSHAKLAGIAAGILGALRAIESTQDTDGLTWAKPDWHVKYAMDQAETYAGLRAAAELEQALGNRSLSQRAANDASRLQQGFAQLWNATTGAYDWAVHGDGAHATTTWSNLYPDATEEVWPVAFGLATSSHAQQVVQHFVSAHPEWDSQYWPVAGWALDAVGSSSAAQTAAASIENVAAQANHAWPFNTGLAGQLIVLESGGFTS